MCKDDVQVILSKMDELWGNFIFIRSKFPAVNDRILGEKKLEIPPIYKRYISNIEGCLYFENGITKNIFDEIRKAGHYINQNFIVCLNALLESNQIVKGQDSIVLSIDGSEHVDILIYLRNKFAHGSGKLNNSKKEPKKYNDKIIKLYELKTPPNNPEEFRLPIDTVLYPLFLGCREYSECYFEAKNSS